MDNDFLEFYITKCTADIQGFTKFLEEKLSSLPKDDTKSAGPETNMDQIRNESIGIIEQMRKIVIDMVKEYFDRFQKEVELVFEKEGAVPSDAAGPLAPRKVIQAKIDNMKESLEKIKKKDPAALKSFLNYDFSKDKVQIENLLKASPLQSSTKPAQKKSPARVVTNNNSLHLLEDALASVLSITYSDIPSSEALCQITSPNYFLNQLDLQFKVASSLVDDTNCLVQYNVEEETITKIPVPKASLAINPRVYTLPDGMTYFIGGVKNGKPCSDTQLLDVITGKMIPKATMKFAKIGNAVCYAKLGGKDYLYSLGGKSENKRLNVCERFSVLENKWEIMANMKVVRAAATASCFNHQMIYVFGGFNGDNKIEATIERYDIAANQWSDVILRNPSSFLPTIESSSVQINDNQIIILGGSRSYEGHLEVSKEIRVFNISEGVITNLGFELANPLNFGNQIVVHERKLFCFGRLRKESKIFGPSDVIFTTIDENGCTNGTIIDISGYEYL